MSGRKLGYSKNQFGHNSKEKIVRPCQEPNQILQTFSPSSSCYTSWVVCIMKAKPTTIISRMLLFLPHCRALLILRLSFLSSQYDTMLTRTPNLILCWVPESRPNSLEIQLKKQNLNLVQSLPSGIYKKNIFHVETLWFELCLSERNLKCLIRVLKFLN